MDSTVAQLPCGVALKEWAVVCAAIARGQQSVLLRKGGIAEGGTGFRFEHERFWLFPTRFHATPEQLTADGAALLTEIEHAPAGEVRLGLLCVARRVIHVTRAEDLAVFAGRHILSPATVRARFDYREPGLFVAEIEVRRTKVDHRIVDAPRFAGCHSWVDLDGPLPFEPA
jgi:hypothetical protein